MAETRYATYPSLRGKVILISGGADGIGASFVESFARQGSKVIFLDIADNLAEALLERVRQDDSNTELSFHHCDVTNLAELKQVTDSILNKHPRIDVLINNAARDTRMSTAEVTPEFWDAQVAVNLRHQFFMTQYVMPGMQQAGAGSIINMGSINWAVPGTGMPAYTTCKAAIVGLTKTHARELGEFGIRVNSIMPGTTATPRQIREIYTPEYIADTMAHQSLKRMVQAEDIARMALFLAADDSVCITNQNHVVDGGWI